AGGCTRCDAESSLHEIVIGAPNRRLSRGSAIIRNNRDGVGVVRLSGAGPMREGRYIMMRIVLAVGAVALGITAVAAQSDPIAARKALMKANGDQAKIGTAMAKGEAPFDQAKVQTIFATFIDAAGKFGALFPEN